MIHTVKGFSIVNKAEVDVFLESKVVFKKKKIYIYKWGFPGGSVVKNPSANAGDTGLIPGREYPLEKEMATQLEKVCAATKTQCSQK